MELLRDWPTGLTLVIASCALLMFGVSHEASRYWAGYTSAQVATDVPSILQ